jgi:hypothetical protein
MLAMHRANRHDRLTTEGEQVEDAVVGGAMNARLMTCEMAMVALARNATVSRTLTMPRRVAWPSQEA